VKKEFILLEMEHAEGKADMRNLLGGKGANLAEMNLIGVPVPPGFTITTDVCNEYFEKGKADVVALLKDDVKASVKHIETLMNSNLEMLTIHCS
jgi:pyruvate,orthophosphate dikinase